mmetsp:Transcript_14503/g.29025  ORF Transcript_14503/g.29025 Transcript_14503/m.29025 type:complete len:361 (+) Transcript_14503:365-1447(+)
MGKVGRWRGEERRRGGGRDIFLAGGQKVGDGTCRCPVVAAAGDFLCRGRAVVVVVAGGSTDLRVVYGTAVGCSGTISTCLRRGATRTPLLLAAPAGVRTLHAVLSAAVRPRSCVPAVYRPSPMVLSAATVLRILMFRFSLQPAGSFCCAACCSAFCCCLLEDTSVRDRRRRPLVGAEEVTGLVALPQYDVRRHRFKIPLFFPAAAHLLWRHCWGAASGNPRPWLARCSASVRDRGRGGGELTAASTFGRTLPSVLSVAPYLRMFTFWSSLKPTGSFFCAACLVEGTSVQNRFRRFLVVANNVTGVITFPQDNADDRGRGRGRGAGGGSRCAGAMEDGGPASVSGSRRRGRGGRTAGAFHS